MGQRSKRVKKEGRDYDLGLYMVEKEKNEHSKKHTKDLKPK